MLLDSGICEICSVRRLSPTETERKTKFRCWYGELEFADRRGKPVYNMEALPEALDGQPQMTVRNRIRVLQNRGITTQDTVVIGGTEYQIIRVYHGMDGENGQPISDLSLSLTEAEP